MGKIGKKTCFASSFVPTIKIPKILNARRIKKSNFVNKLYQIIINRMKEFNLEGHEFIELNKLLKLMRTVGSGGEANGRIVNGEIMVNGLVETRKRNKLKAGDVVSFQDVSIIIR